MLSLFWQIFGIQLDTLCIEPITKASSLWFIQAVSISRYMEEKNITNKDKYIVKAAVQTLKKG